MKTSPFLEENMPSERVLLFWLVCELVFLEAQPSFSTRRDHPQFPKILSLSANSYLWSDVLKQ